jgi:hypothetical protein
MTSTLRTLPWIGCAPFGTTFFTGTTRLVDSFPDCDVCGAANAFPVTAAAVAIAAECNACLRFMVMPRVHSCSELSESRILARVQRCEGENLVRSQHVILHAWETLATHRHQQSMSNTASTSNLILPDLIGARR